MHHFVVPSAALRADTVTFTPTQQHQIARVLRLRDGDTVVVLDGAGAQYTAEVAIAGQEVCGTIVGPTTACREVALRLTLIVAPPKGERWEWLLQKGTELGVAAFIPVSARYSQPGTVVVRPRHREIVREATEQCRRLLLPHLDDPQPLQQAWKRIGERGGSTALLWEGEAPLSLPTLLATQRAANVQSLCLIVGPEGGFHADEIQRARDQGIPLVGLGPLTLRAETAAVAAAAVALSSAW